MKMSKEGPRIVKRFGPKIEDGFEIELPSDAKAWDPVGEVFFWQDGQRTDMIPPWKEAGGRPRVSWLHRIFHNRCLSRRS